MLSYKFIYIELAGLIDLGAKFPFLKKRKEKKKKDLSEFVKTGAFFQP